MFRFPYRLVPRKTICSFFNGYPYDKKDHTNCCRITCFLCCQPDPCPADQRMDPRLGRYYGIMFSANVLCIIFISVVHKKIWGSEPWKNYELNIPHKPNARGRFHVLPYPKQPVLLPLSSAGLRVLLVMHKNSENGVSMSNVSPAVTEILAQTGFDSIFSIWSKNLNKSSKLWKKEL